jgi:hypothetical protein
VVSEMVSAIAGHVSKKHLDRAPGSLLHFRRDLLRLATWKCQSVEEFFLTREEAEDCLRRVLEDEPGWTDVVGIVRLDFSSEEPGVEVLA